MPRILSRIVIRLVIFAIVLCISWFVRQQKNATAGSSRSAPASAESGAPFHVGLASGPAVAGHVRDTWGRPETLPDHFARHGQDFHARDVDDYAAQAAAFLQHAKAAGLPAKRDHDGSLRIYDQATGTFAAYNADGTTKTFFKPGNSGYFERQPGAPVDLRTLR